MGPLPQSMADGQPPNVAKPLCWDALVTWIGGGDRSPAKSHSVTTSPEQEWLLSHSHQRYHQTHPYLTHFTSSARPSQAAEGGMIPRRELVGGGQVGSEPQGAGGHHLFQGVRTTHENEALSFHAFSTVPSDFAYKIQIQRHNY